MMLVIIVRGYPFLAIYSQLVQHLPVVRYRREPFKGLYDGTVV